MCEWEIIEVGWTVGRLDRLRANVHGRFLAMLEMTLICEYVLLDKDGLGGL